MMLDDAKLHLEEMLKLIKHLPEDSVEPEYLSKLKEFVDKFKNFNPEVFVYLSGGTIQQANANSNVIFNLWDNDIRIQYSDYEDQLEEWNWMIETGIKNGTLKNIY